MKASGAGWIGWSVVGRSQLALVCAADLPIRTYLVTEGKRQLREVVRAYVTQRIGEVVEELAQRGADALSRHLALQPLPLQRDGRRRRGRAKSDHQRKSQKRVTSFMHFVRVSFETSRAVFASKSN